MKLNNYHKDAFVLSVMNDVPEIDYGEEIKKLFFADMLAQCPPEVRKLWADEKMRGWLEQNSERPLAKLCDRETRETYSDETYRAIRFSVWGPWGSHAEGLPAPKPTAAIAKKIDALGRKMIKQAEDRAKLRSKLRAVVFSTSTRATVAKMLPEFEKYLPLETPPMDRSVPVVANVIADFIKAGWPKDKKPKTAVAA